MIATLVIVFRELIEAGLIVGIIMSATRGVYHRGRWVSGGILTGLFGACLVAAFAQSISRAFEGVGQEIMNASVLGFAVLMLGWHNVWMARHGRTIATEIKTLGNAVTTGQRSLFALATVIAIAVLREGAEVVLFLYGVVLSSNAEGVAPMVLGGALGLILGAGMSALMYFGLLRIPTRHLFSVTSWLIALLAAGMAAQAVSFLQQAGLETQLTAQMWDSSAVISETSVLGKMLHTLIGYVDRPNELQVMAYVATVITIFGLMVLLRPAPRVVAVV